ncbi:hypothetical protein MIZ01_2103 [Sideroxyarcus emersonii]|uniref:Uncharacterized protein n=1 Tax=Sideroxyarcus emersonii TaxID=2764705 RepID=A0AAN2BZL1_9PROT|nr:hypothetical protein MIZ01_2103 [Sideroxyarcus emersonii]
MKPGYIFDAFFTFEAALGMDCDKMYSKCILSGGVLFCQA